MSTVCTYCGDPILPTEKSSPSQTGKIHYRCVKRGKPAPDAPLTVCPSCQVLAYSQLFGYCFKCKAGLNVGTIP